MKLSSSEIQTVKDYLKSKPVVRAFLFGSYSNGMADKDSDVDLLVELDYSKHIGLAFVQIKYELEDKLNKRVDLVSSKGLSKHIEPFINHEKMLIYER